MKLSAHKVRHIIDNTIISSLFTKSGCSLDPVVALNKLKAIKQNDNTYILHGCTITIKADQPYNFTVHKIK